jgi:hypothetical protein
MSRIDRRMRTGEPENRGIGKRIRRRQKALRKGLREREKD